MCKANQSRTTNKDENYILMYSTGIFQMRLIIGGFYILLPKLNIKLWFHLSPRKSVML
jgi:hypothetical protein